MSYNNKNQDMTDGQKCFLWVMAIIIVGIVAMFWSTRDPSSSKPTQTRSEMRCNSAGTAAREAKRFVRSSLRSPSTAKFPWGSEITRDLGNCRHRVLGYVDAQNVFGATVRQNYVAVVKYNEARNIWTLESIRM